MNTIDKILLGCAGFLLIFTITMIVVFCIKDAIPDTLVTCVFSALTGEAIITFVIWWVKKKATTRKDTKDE